MATVEEKLAAQSCRETLDAATLELGHAMTWKLGRDSLRKGCSYRYVGGCRECGAEVMADAGGATCPGERDARYEQCAQMLVDVGRSS